MKITHIWLFIINYLLFSSSLFSQKNNQNENSIDSISVKNNKAYSIRFGIDLSKPIISNIKKDDYQGFELVGDNFLPLSKVGAGLFKINSDYSGLLSSEVFSNGSVAENSNTTSDSSSEGLWSLDSDAVGDYHPGDGSVHSLLNLSYSSSTWDPKEIVSSNDKFTIGFLSNGEIFETEFIEGGTQLLNFNVKEMDQLFVIKIPLKYLLNPYDVYFTEKDDASLDQIDKIRKTEFAQDDTHVNVSFRTLGEGTVSIVGATPEEHKKKLEQIEKIKSSEVKNEVIEKERGLALPIPGTKSASELASQYSQIDEEKIDELSFAEELKNQTSNSEDNMTMIIIIAGIIIAGIIGGIILKLKKN